MSEPQANRLSLCLFWEYVERELSACLEKSGQYADEYLPESEYDAEGQVFVGELPQEDGEVV